MFGSHIGRRLGDFRIKAPLGQGGTGDVYLAEQLTLPREVVVKVLRTTDGDPQTDRFLREVQLASKLDHPFAAHVYAFGVEEDRTHWIAMELVRGTGLDQLLEAQGKVPLSRMVALLDRLCEVIAAAHDQGIVHRDIKPANVMVIQRAGRWLPKLLDLGIARASEPDPIEPTPTRETLPGDQLSALAGIETLNLTSRGAILGTPYYMAPEQWGQAHTVDGRADVYSLALLTFQCLTGRLPFPGETVLEVARGHARNPIPALGPEFPLPLHAVISKAAAKRANGRFATALEFAAEFRRASGIGIEPQGLPSRRMWGGLPHYSDVTSRSR